MPIMNGYDACIELRKLIKESKIRPMHIVAVTADATKENEKICMEVGFEGFIIKPVGLNELRDLL